MTPLAARLVKRSTLPLRDRGPFDDPDGALRLLDDIHCFEMTAVMPLVFDLCEQLKTMNDGNPAHAERTVEHVSFLPAPATWIEAMVFEGGQSARIGILLTEKPSGWADVYLFSQRGCAHLGEKSLSSGLALADPQNQHVLSMVQAMLVLINTPRIIGRKQHMPNVGLERRLAKAKKMVGRFPLHAWTEIQLQVRPPDVDGKEHEAHLTGAKALHFCRAHLRVRLGRLEYVSAHWRGDPALGIKQSRYVLNP